MPSTSTLLSAVILVVTLIGIVVYAFAEQLIRYNYLQQLSERIARTQEAVSVSTWYRRTVIVAEVRNIAGRGVYVKELKFIVNCKITYTVGGGQGQGEIHVTTTTVTKSFYNISLHTYDTKYLAFDIADDAIKNSGISANYVKDIAINYIASTVITERNVFIFDPSPSMTATVFEIYRNYTGGGFNIILPNGRIAQVRVYEYLFCGIGSSSRLNTYMDKVGEATKVMVAYSPSYSSIRDYFYQFSYDYDKKTVPSASITIQPYNKTVLKGGTAINATICSVSVPGYSLDGKMLTVSRGVLLIGTQLSGYDIVAVLFVKTPYPKYIDPTQVPGYRYSGVTLTQVKSYVYVNKIPLPSDDISPMDFMGPQIAFAPGVNNTSIMAIGNYYSQAILIGVAVTGVLSGTGSSIDVYTEFEDPYPILLIIAAPSIR